MQRARTSTLLIGIALFLATALISGCQSISVYDGKGNLRSVALTDYGIVFEIPGAWDISLSRDRYFQFVAVYREDSRPLAVLEYRGLDTEPRDKRSRDLYATGWYDAMRLNYPGWKYQDRSNDDASESFTFEGSYLEGTTRYIKIGKLRFKDRRIHAIYYTAPEEEMDHLRDIFEAIDEEIRY
ncbi:MAG: hypothetical protein KDK23_06130 [Leptospiraceae bacterium]|nr:hypothetical protein [Leptospiraceae bacterium]